jgi:hypothetical protein
MVSWLHMQALNSLTDSGHPKIRGYATQSVMFSEAELTSKACQRRPGWPNPSREPFVLKPNIENIVPTPYTRPEVPTPSFQLVMLRI